MNFDEVIASFIGAQLGGSANRSDAQYFKRLLEENKATLDIENSSLSDKMYLYLLFHIDVRQRAIRDIVRKAKKVEDISDNDMIDVFNDLIAEYSGSKYRRDRLTTYFLEFKSEIDKRPLVGANLVLAGFEIVAKSNDNIKDDQDYARFVDRGKSYPTKQYIKYLTEDNTQYFAMQDIVKEGTRYYSDPTITLQKCRNIELLKNNYHLYLMYCLGHEDIAVDDLIPSESYDKKLINTDELHLLYDKYINTKLLSTLQTDVHRKKFDLTKAKKFISYYKGKLLQNEYDVIQQRLDSQGRGYGGMGITFNWETIRTGVGWYNREDKKTGKIVVGSYWYGREMCNMYTPKYVYVLLTLLYIFKDDIAKDVKDVLDILKSSYLYCSSSDEWKEKNKLFYSGISANSKDMNTAFPEFWSLGGKVSDYILKFEFRENFTDDGKYVLDYNKSSSNPVLRDSANHIAVKEIVDGIESLLNTIGNN